MQCKLNSHPANFIRHAYSRHEYVCANTIGVATVSSYWLKFAALHLFVVTMPIQKAVTSGNENIEFYRETARSNLK
jgi:hypothetical protein